MEKDKTVDHRLSKRNWIMANITYYLEQAVYHRTHKENFKFTRYKLWVIGEDEGRLSLGKVEEYVH